jgi:hypothetical protein
MWHFVVTIQILGGALIGYHILVASFDWLLNILAKINKVNLSIPSVYHSY